MRDAGNASSVGAQANIDPDSHLGPYGQFQRAGVELGLQAIGGEGPEAPSSSSSGSLEEGPRRWASILK